MNSGSTVSGQLSENTYMGMKNTIYQVPESYLWIIGSTDVASGILAGLASHYYGAENQAWITVGILALVCVAVPKFVIWSIKKNSYVMHVGKERLFKQGEVGELTPTK